MRTIKILDNTGKLQTVDAGISKYSELSDAPIRVTTLYTKVDINENEVVLTPLENHRWTKDELNNFCGVVDGKFNYDMNIQDGRYDIITEEFGHEMLLIDTAEVSGIPTRRCRRITSQYDWIFDERANDWINISDDSAGSLIFTIDPIKENITYGTNVELKYSYYSATGKIGTMQLYVNDTLKTTVSRNSSTSPYTMNITNFLSIGENNILFTVQSGDQKEELFIRVNVINLVLSSTFNDKQLYQGNALDYTYDLLGSINKTIYFKFDDNEPIKKEYSANNVIGAIEKLDISSLNHGVHTLEVWAEAYAGTEPIKTTSLFYTLPIWKNKNGETILVLNEAPAVIEQGATAIIKYSPYNADTTSIEVSESFPPEFGAEPIVLKITSGSQRSWSFVAKEIGNFNFTITSGNSILTVPMEIKLGEQIDYVSEGLLYSLDLIGRDNALDNKNIIKYETISVDQSKVHEAIAKMDDFNYSTDGWLMDEDEGGRNILRVNATSWVTYEGMDLLTLLSNTNYSGCTFEVDFKGRNTTNANRKLITLTTNSGQGISINEQSVTVVIAGSTYSVEYKAEERIRLSITIGSNVDDKRRIMIYVNGILSFVSEYTSASFGGYTSNLVINPVAGFVDIYGLRLYGSELTMGQVLNNYIASFNTSADRVTARDWNAIYSEDGSTVSYDKVKTLMPTFVFSTNDKDGENNLPPAKGVKRYGPIQYVDPLYSKSFTEEYKGDSKKPVGDVQGTSSQKYPRKNFKIKTNNKHVINDCVVGEKVFTFKKDFMDSSHANNTGLAKLVQTLYFTPVPPQISYIVWKDTEDTEHVAYDKDGNKIDFNYIYNYGETIGDPFSSISNINIEVSLLLEDNKAYFKYKKTNGATEYTVCEIETGDKVASSVAIKDKSYVRTTVYGQPCAFFWNPKGGELADSYIYQGIYNFNTDKVATNNMELEEEGSISFEFTNNVSNGALFINCENYTDVRNSFELRAYENNDISLGLLEDYYLDDEEEDSGLVSYANGGEDDGDIIPILNALYGTDQNGNEYQLHTEVDGTIVPINYPMLTKNYELFSDSDPRTLEATYRLENNNIEASFTASRGKSDEIKIAETIEEKLGGDSYFSSKNTTKAPSGLAEGQALGVQIINQGTEYIVQWGYETNGSVQEWFDYVYVADLLTTIEETGVNQTDVEVNLKSGKRDDLRWSYSYPIEQIWVVIAPSDKIYADTIGTQVQPVSLRKYDLFEEMYNPIMNVINWVIDCYRDYETTKSTTKFKNEFNQHLNKEYVITYYVMGLFAGAADSFAKNMFWNSYDGGQIWYPVYYDIDTCFGLSNDGHPNFPYSLEIYGEGSKLGTADIYNGAKSNFWKLVYASYASDIQAKYNELRSNRLTYETVMNVLYDQQIALIAPAHYNEDAKFSYLDYPSYYYTAQGSRYERLKYWIESRFSYLDSEMENERYTVDSFELRSNAGLPLEVTTDMTIFVGVKYGQHIDKIFKTRCEQNGTVIFDPRSFGVDKINDLETLIYGASHVKSLGDLSEHQVTSIKFPDSGKSVLQNIVIGSENEDYENTNFTTLSVGSNSSLEVLNVSNCINLGKENSTLDLSKCPSVKTVLAKNTKLTNIKLPEGSPIFQLHLPSVQEINLVNQILLSDFTVDSYKNVSRIVWENVPKSELTIENILNNIYMLDNNTVLSEVRIIGYNNAEAVTTAWMEWLMKISGTNDANNTIQVPYITGQLTIQSLDKDELKSYVAAFNEATNSNFAFVSTYDKENEQYHYYKYNSVEDFYEEITEEETKEYKLNLKLEQLVADENIFGVSGEGR